MRRPALLLAVGLIAAGCIAPPDDATGIRRLLRAEAAARARGDHDALYRMHDPDYRAICPFERFAESSIGPSELGAVESIELRGSRGWATVIHGGERIRRPLVKDAGRWYLYADTQACAPAAGSGQQGAGSISGGSTIGRTRLPVPRSRLPDE